MRTTEAETDWQIHRLTMMNESPRAPAFNYCFAASGEMPIDRLLLAVRACVASRRHYAEEFIRAMTVIVIDTVIVIVIPGDVVITQRLQILKDRAPRRYAYSRRACIAVSTSGL